MFGHVVFYAPQWLGMTHPVVLAPMAVCCTPALVAGVSNVGEQCGHKACMYSPSIDLHPWQGLIQGWQSCATLAGSMPTVGGTSCAVA
jgi:hypothetical protein